MPAEGGVCGSRWSAGGADGNQERGSPLIQKDPEPGGQERARSSTDPAGVRKDVEISLELEQGRFCIHSFIQQRLIGSEDTEPEGVVPVLKLLQAREHGPRGDLDEVELKCHGGEVQPLETIWDDPQGELSSCSGFSAFPKEPVREATANRKTLVIHHQNIQ